MPFGMVGGDAVKETRLVRCAQPLQVAAKMQAELGGAQACEEMERVSRGATS